MVDNLGVTTAPDGGKMLLIGTGLKGYPAGNGKVSFPTCLPPGEYVVIFQWKFYSEEFKEWCGSQFQDAFHAKLETPIGTLPLVELSIDDLCDPGDGSCKPGECGASYAGLTPSDVSFDQGGVYNTPWQTTVKSLTITENTPATLQFSLSDAGDSIYDTVVLIDAIFIAPCSPSCADKECGSDGCGGVCGSCASTTTCALPTCGTDGLCVLENAPAGAPCTPDANLCTADVCGEVGDCLHVPTPGAPCATDGSVCTDDVCDEAAECIHPPTEDGGVCESDGNECTKDACAAGECVHLPTPSAPCSDDDNECTDDLCDAGAVCTHPAVADGEPCTDDGQACTQDACEAGACAHAPLAAEMPCDDGLVCTEAACDGEGTCAPVAEVPGCCTADAACDDELPCTSDACDEDTNMCTSTPIPGAKCCALDTECDDLDDVCTSEVCAGGLCQYTFADLPECCDPTPLSEGFEAFEDGWLFEGSSDKCHWGVVSGGQSQSGAWSLYYGDPVAKNYNCGVSSGSATTPPMLLPGAGGKLAFQFWSDVEKGSSYDKTEVVVIADGTATVVLTKSTLPSVDAWTPVEISLDAFAGKTIQIQFTFKSVDSLYNSTEGVYVDDVVVSFPCGGP